MFESSEALAAGQVCELTVPQADCSRFIKITGHKSALLKLKIFTWRADHS